jgi:hypothetical protein
MNDFIYATDSNVKRFRNLLEPRSMRLSGEHYKNCLPRKKRRRTLHRSLAAKTSNGEGSW